MAYFWVLRVFWTACGVEGDQKSGGEGVCVALRQLLGLLDGVLVVTVTSHVIEIE